MATRGQKDSLDRGRERVVDAEKLNGADAHRIETGLEVRIRRVIRDVKGVLTVAMIGRVVVVDNRRSRSGRGIVRWRCRRSRIRGGQKLLKTADCARSRRANRSGSEAAAKVGMRICDLGAERRVALGKGLRDDVIDETVAVD